MAIWSRRFTRVSLWVSVSTLAWWMAADLITDTRVVLLGIATAVALAAFALGVAAGGLQETGPRLSVVAASLIWGTAFVVTVVGSRNGLMGYLAALATIAAVAACPDRSFAFGDVAVMLVMLLAAALAYGTWGMVTGSNAPFLIAWARELLGLPQLKAFMRHPNNLAPLAALAILLSAASAARLRILRPALTVALGVLGLAVLVWSQSRTTGIAVVVALSAMVVVRWRPRYATAVVGVLTFAGVVVPLALGPFGLSMNGRSTAWEVGLEAFWQQPLLGWGVKAYSLKWFWPGFPGRPWRPAHGHNELIHSAVQGGLVEVVALGAAWLIVVLAVRRLSTRAVLLVAPVLVLYGVMSGTEIPLGYRFTPGSNLTPMLAAALLLAAARLADPPGSTPGPGDEPSATPTRRPGRHGRHAAPRAA